MAYTEDDYDVTELGDVEELEDDACPLCRGTGIGQFGDPDTSKCHRCNGSGVRREADEDQGAMADEAYDRWRDEQDERERERAL